MYIIKRKKRNPGEHVYIPELQELYRAGRITRREFMRNACLLGMSFAAASLFVTSCGGDDDEEAPTGGEVEGLKRGGTLTFSSAVQGIDHPARYSWIDGDANITRHVIEYLTRTDQNNVTHPHLLEKWEASDDLKTWTLHLREGVTWTTGEPFNADDVVFTMKEWLNPDVGSSVLGLMNYLQPTGIEKVDDMTVRLNLDSPQLGVPEHLFHYPSPMLDHRTFKGDWLENPVGTGPFTLEEWSTSERAVLKARTDYWKKGADGKPLPYLDELRFVWLGDSPSVSTIISSLKGGQIDVTYPSAEVMLAAKDDGGIAIASVPTTQTDVLRMRVDVEPWTDNRVRTALKLCQDKDKIIQLAYFGEAIPGPDCHASPVHPEFSPMEHLPKDTEKAKALLAEAGYPDGLDVNLVVSAGGFQESYATILKEDAEAAGLRINIDAVPTSSYWDVWTEVDLGITSWTHRPLAVMVMPLAYVCDKEGTPVPWNETRWCDEEFDTLLSEAMGTLDVEARRKIMADLQRIQVERGSIGIPWWKNSWIAYNPKFKGLKAHPTEYNFTFSEAWIDEEA